MSTLPSFPSATVEFNVLHDALHAGDDPKLAAAKAVAAGRGETIEEPTSFTGKSKTDLLRIAKAENVELPDNATVPVIIDAIEQARTAKLVESTGIADAPPSAPPAEIAADVSAPDATTGD